MNTVTPEERDIYIIAEQVLEPFSDHACVTFRWGAVAYETHRVAPAFFVSTDDESTAEALNTALHTAFRAHFGHKCIINDVYWWIAIYPARPADFDLRGYFESVGEKERTGLLAAERHHQNDCD